MNPYFHPTHNIQAAEVTVYAQRIYDGHTQAPWLLSIQTRVGAVSWNTVPQAHAVIDDFGTLVPVEAWS